MDWTAEMDQTFYMAESQGATNYASRMYGAQQGPFICKAKKVRRLVQSEGGSEIQADTQLICYQQVKAKDKIWAPGSDPTKDIQARDVLSATSESLLGDSSQLLYVVLL